MLLMSLGNIIIGSGIEAKIAGWLGLVFFGACTISFLIIRKDAQGKVAGILNSDKVCGGFIKKL